MEEIEFHSLKTLVETSPLWYQDERIGTFLKLFTEDGLNRKEKSLKRGFKELLKKSSFFVGEEGYEWDQWRLPIEYAVIHHTSSAPTISLREMDVLGLRLYVEQFLTNDDVKNQPLYSGHYWYKKTPAKENMAFVSYHYLVRPTGRVIQLVEDSAYLWHAGNLEVNRKSIGIALAGKFIDKEPTTKSLEAVAEIIKKYKTIEKDKVVGHKEVIKKYILGDTECPGNHFDDWKYKIISLL